MGHHGYSVSCPVIQVSLHSQVASFKDSGSTTKQLHLDLPAECNNFDWESEYDVTKDDISPMLFRPGHPESPIGIDFDHERASLGKLPKTIPVL